MTRTRPHPRVGDPAKPAHWCHDLLTAEQERALVERASAGERAARDELILKNQRLVLKIAASHLRRAGSLDIDDLVSAGNRGLIRAAELFSPALGLRFGTYAVRWIRHTVLREIQDAGRTIRMPQDAAAKIGRYRRAEARLQRLDGKPPCFDRVCDAMGLSGRRRRSLRDALVASGLEFVTCTGENEPAVPVATEAGETWGRVVAALDRLTPVQSEAVRLYYGLDEGEPPLSLSEIARRDGVSPQAVATRRSKAIRRLRSLLAS